MKVIHIVKTLALAYGGPARSVQGLVAALESAGVETHLVTIEDGGSPWVEGIKHYHCLNAKGRAEVMEKLPALIDEIKPDIIHTHDCWMPILHACHCVARQKKIPYVISPRGSLKRWSRHHKWLKKWIALKTYEGYDLRHALALHVTAQDEYEQVKELGYNDNFIQLTNGLTLPSEEELRKCRAAKVDTGKKRALFLSRIHYTKGLMNLVEAWAKVRPQGWEMEIVGTDADGYQKVIQEAVKKYGLENDFIFSGPVKDADKYRKYCAADLLIHPSFTENFGIVVTEALYAGIPVITTKGAPWEDLVTHKCGWWVELGVDPLVEAMKTAISLDDATRAEMGARGKQLVLDKYSWPMIGRQMRDEYARCLKKD